MKNFFVLILFVALALPAALKIGIVADYWVDYNYYVTVLCENKDKPELKCNGTCQLAKELKKTEPKAPDAPAVLNLEPVFFLESIEEKSILKEVAETPAILHKSDNPCPGWTNDLVRPPIS